VGSTTGISWCHRTFNPWWGCGQISPACAKCYAKSLDGWLHRGAHWGPYSDRLFFGDEQWGKPRRWNRAAALAGKRHRVFCASMADVFENRADLVPHRARLWKLIEECTNLDWLLLSKRPENMPGMVPWHADGSPPWPHVWLGTTTESQHYADLRIPLLLQVPAVVHFLSCEPLLGPIVLDGSKDGPHWFARGINWVIAGCEHGAGARPTDVEWLRSLRDQCTRNSVAFFFKQGSADLVTITAGPRSKKKARGVVELPYLDHQQWTEFPR
jgi:protein gp37